MRGAPSGLGDEHPFPASWSQAGGASGAHTHVIQAGHVMRTTRGCGILKGGVTATTENVPKLGLASRNGSSCLLPLGGSRLEGDSLGSHRYEEWEVAFIATGGFSAPTGSEH